MKQGFRIPNSELLRLAEIHERTWNDDKSLILPDEFYCLFCSGGWITRLNIPHAERYYLHQLEYKGHIFMTYTSHPIEYYLN